MKVSKRRTPKPELDKDEMIAGLQDQIEVMQERINELEQELSFAEGKFAEISDIARY